MRAGVEGRSDPVTDPPACGCAAARAKRNAGRREAWSPSTERGKGDLQQKDQPAGQGGKMPRA